MYNSQLIDALFRSDDMRLAETRLERTRRMAESKRYKHPSRILAEKLSSDLQDAKENLARKSDELASRLRRLAQLSGVDEVLARTIPAIELAWLQEGDLQKWGEIAEPAVRAYFGTADTNAKQKGQMNALDTR